LQLSGSEGVFLRWCGPVSSAGLERSVVLGAFGIRGAVAWWWPQRRGLVGFLIVEGEGVLWNAC
jgi:hypothetical protein